MSLPEEAAPGAPYFVNIKAVAGTELAGYTRHPTPETLCCVAGVRDLPDELVRQSAAVHEAGHAIVARLLDTAPTPIRLNEPKRSSCCGRLDVGGANVGLVLPAELRAGVTVLAAGERAETLWLTACGLWTPGRAWAADAGALDDQQYAAELLAACNVPLTFGTRALGDWWTCGQLAEGVLRSRWRAVLALAETLAADGELSADRAAAFTGAAAAMGGSGISRAGAPDAH